MKPVDRNARLREHILAGGTPKEFAFNWRISVALVGKALSKLGLRKHFLTDDEYRRILSMRGVTKKP